MGTKNWEVVKVERNSAGSSAPVRAEGERERKKEQKARDFFWLMKRYFGDLVVCSEFSCGAH